MLNTFIDLFAGIGGFRLALEAQGLRCVFSSEIDKDACDVYEANFGERPSGDITKIDAKDIPDHDILCGGFPCQPFAIQGKKQGFEDARGTLFFDIMRIASEKRPKMLLLENVPGLFELEDGKNYRYICDHIQEAEYDLAVYRLNAMRYGVPQSRDRLYFVATRKDLELTSWLPEPWDIPVRASDVMLSHDDPRCPPPHDSSKLHHRQHPGEYNIASFVSGNIYPTARDVGRVYWAHRPSGTLYTWHPPRLEDEKIVRFASAREMARLSGFPDSFVIPEPIIERDKPHKRYVKITKLFGNTVIPRMVALAFMSIHGPRQTDLFR